MPNSLSRVLIRETLVLAAGAVVAATIAMLIHQQGKGWELVHGIVTPIAFCLVRLASASYPYFTPYRRWVLSQVLLALALIALLLFEIGIGLFATAQGIPREVWFVLAGMGFLYVAFMTGVESIRQTPS